MNDLEICRKIATIEGITFVWVVDQHQNVQSMGYNPLAWDAVCYKLMIKHKIVLRYNDEHMYAFNGKRFVCDENPNRAICLAIIAGHKP